MNRVWIYLSDKAFDEAVISELKNDISSFLAGWNAHGTSLSSSFEIFHNRFIIIKADEEKFSASGCSIDKQFQFIKETEKKFGVNLLNRLLVAYKSERGIEVVHSSKIPELLAAGKINENTIVFNTAAANDEELKNNFEIPLSKSWLSRYLHSVK